MIDSKEAIETFKAKFDRMTYSEREEYLQRMGFTFGDKPVINYRLKDRAEQHRLSGSVKHSMRKQIVVHSIKKENRLKSMSDRIVDSVNEIEG